MQRMEGNGTSGPQDAAAAVEREDYKAALKHLEKAIFPLRLHDDIAGLDAIAQEARRIAGLTAVSRRVSNRALEVAVDAERAATTVREDVARSTATGTVPEDGERQVIKDVSPVSAGIAVVGAAILLIAVFLPRVESNTFGGVA
jgi:hypothetical protein